MPKPSPEDVEKVQAICKDSDQPENTKLQLLRQRCNNSWDVWEGSSYKWYKDPFGELAPIDFWETKHLIKIEWNDRIKSKNKI